MIQYDNHNEWVQHLAELGCLKESHNACLQTSHCVAEDDE